MVDFAQIYPNQKGQGFNPDPQTWEVRQTNLFDAATPYASGSANERTPLPITGMYINRVERECTLYVGSGNRYKIGVLNPGMRMSIILPSNVTEYAFTWIGGNQPFDETHDSTIEPICEVWTSSQAIFYAESFDPGPRFGSLYQPFHHTSNPGIVAFDEMPFAAPTVLAFPMLTDSTEGAEPDYTAQGNNEGPRIIAELVAAVGPYAKYRAIDLTMTPGNARSAASYSYSVPFRRGATPRQWSVTLAAGGLRDVGTFFLSSLADRYMRLHKVEVQLLGVTAVTDIEVLLIRTSTAPTGGNTANPVQLANSYTGLAGATSPAQTQCRLTPTAGSTYGDVITGFVLSPGITGAASTTNPPTIAPFITLYDDTFPDSVSPIEVLANSGICIRVESSAAATITGYCRAYFTEYDNL